MTTMRFGQYIAKIEYDPDVDRFCGRVVNLSSPVTFQGRTPAELRREFNASIKIYMDICRERGIEPEKPYSGKFNVRISPETHRKAALAASLRGTSLNTFVDEVISKETETVLKEN